MATLSTIQQTAVFVPGMSPDTFPWDKYPTPRLLYKYLPPDRFHILTDCLVRFSQREVFEDAFELLPEVAHFGDEDEIRKFMEVDPVLRRHPSALREVVIRHVLENPEREAGLIRETVGWLTGPREFGVFCLTENPASDRMWREYADHGRGFVVAFDSTHPAFELLRSPGRLGKVEYSDEPISSFLSTYGVNTFFRKRTRYAFEQEWRSIRRLVRFRTSDISRPESALPIYRAPFDPASIVAILLGPDCAVEWEIRNLAAIDCRYRHVEVKMGVA
jgi:hypothetical protein